MNFRHPWAQLYLTRLREFYREPEALFWVYGFPLLLAIGLGIAFMNRKPEPIQIDIQQTEDEAAVNALATLLRAQDIHVDICKEADCLQRRRTGKTVLYLVPLSQGKVRFVFDETQAESRAAVDQVEAALLRSQIHSSWNPERISQQEPGSRYIDFLVPGLIGMNLLGGGLWGVGFVIVDMRVRKLLKRLLATPMRRSHFLLSVLGARLTLMVPDMVLLVLAGWLLFGVQIQGNPLTLALVMLAGGIAFSGIGLLLACRTGKTETISGLINLVLLPMWLLSGTFFSSRRFPDAAQPFIQALPLTQLNNALREVMLDGAPLTEVAWRVVLLVMWGVVSFLLGLRLFRWQ